MDESQVKCSMDAIKARALFVDNQYKSKKISKQERDTELKNLNNQYAEYNKGLMNFRTKK